MPWTQIVGPLADNPHNHDAAYSPMGHDHDTDYDAIGAAAAAVSAHEGASNPHPTYLTQAEGNALYADIAHVHASTFNSETGLTYIFVLSDAHSIVEFDNSSPITATIPPNSSVAYPVGTVIELIQVGSGQVSIAPGSGVTVNAYIGLKLAGQWAYAKLIKRATNTWILVGDLAA